MIVASPNGKIGGGILAGSYLAQNLSRLSPRFVRSQRTIAPNLQESLWTIPARAGWAISQYESLGSAWLDSNAKAGKGTVPFHIASGFWLQLVGDFLRQLLRRRDRAGCPDSRSR